MFVLAVLQDVVVIPPHLFKKAPLEVIETEINKKFANKLIPTVGLCIRLHSVLHSGAAFLYPGDGASSTQTKFALIIFKPFVDEVLEGVVKNLTVDGISVSLGFFDDIIIPKDKLSPNTYFEPSEKVYVWNYNNAEYFIEKGLRLRFKVTEVKFNDRTISALPPPPVDTSSTLKLKKVSAPVGSINEGGLGPTEWW